MRCLFLLLGLLLPQMLRAQFNAFEPGSYVLTGSPAVRQPARLRLQSGTKLVAKTADGKTIKFKPEQIQSFRIANRQYVTASNFHVKGGLGGADIDKGFAEQLDSGQVVLLRYTYTVGGGAPMMGAGGGMGYGGSSELQAYLLRRTGDAQVTAVQGSFYTGGGKQFREAVRPYLSSRPDLLKLLDEKYITSDDLPAVVRALNNNLPFNAPTPARTTN